MKEGCGIRIRVHLSGEKPVVLPKYYQHLLQTVIYQMIPDKQMRERLHNEGYRLEKRSFKPISFSWLQGAYQINKQTIIFPANFCFEIGSIFSEIIQTFAEALLRKGSIRFGYQWVQVEEVEMIEPPTIKEKMVVKALSPITIYSTFYSLDRKKFTHFYDPRDAKFSELIHQNLLKKAKAFYDEDWGNVPFRIKPSKKITMKNLRTIRYKGLIIKGWMGEFIIEGDPRFHHLAYHVGLGGKNGSGFGCIAFKE